MKRLVKCLLLFPLVANAASFTGSFIEPTEREDGTALDPSEIAGHTLIMNGINIQTIQAGQTSFTVDQLPTGS